MKIITKKIEIKYQYLALATATRYLRELHNHCGLSYKYIAGQIGVTPQTISRWMQAGKDAVSEIQPAKQIQIWDLVEKHLDISGRCQ